MENKEKELKEELNKDLKKYGIIKEDNSFNEKLSSDDVAKFLGGSLIVADNKDKRLTFQIVDNKLDVKAYQRDKDLNNVLADAKKEIQYSDIRNIYNPEKGLEMQKKAFVYDDATKKVVEYDLVKDAEKLTQIVAERKDLEESRKFMNALLKMKEHLQEKIDKFPEIAKDITNDLNIVSKTINTINDATPNESQTRKQQQTRVQLGVDDPDRYQDANRRRDEERQQKQNEDREIEQEQEIRRGRRR